MIINLLFARFKDEERVYVYSNSKLKGVLVKLKFKYNGRVYKVLHNDFFKPKKLNNAVRSLIYGGS